SDSRSRGSQSRSSGESNRSERSTRERSSDNNSQSSNNSSRGWTRHRDRGKDKDRDKDRDRDRGRGRERDSKLKRRDRDRDRDDRIARSTRVYQSSNYGNYRYSSNAYDRGYQDGLYTGANDARREQSYDPERSHFYRHGGSGFLSSFGNRGTYQDAYRDGFLRGYEEGYQHYEIYFSGGRFHQ